MISLICFLSNFAFAKAPVTTRTIFIVQSNRDRQTLEKDAELIFNRITTATGGDSVHAFTTNNQEIITLDLPEKQNKLLEKKAKQLAVNQLKAAFLKLIDNPPAEGESVDVAAAIQKALARFNTKPHDEMVLVLLADGLQIDSSFSWKGGFPSDSWISNVNSPFASIASNSARVPLKVLMLPTQGSYVDAYHASRIQRFYQLFFQHRNAQLLFTSDDHRAMADLLRNGVKIAPPKPIGDAHLEGGLGFTKVTPIAQN
jgi:hypothetical protein